MVIHASKDFAVHFKIPFSFGDKKPTQERKLESWSGHVLKLRGEHIAIMMNDASLYAIIIPLKGVRTFEQFLKLFLERVAEVWNSCGAGFDPGNQCVMVLKRTNRSLIGCMNEAVFTFVDDMRNQLVERGRVDWVASEQGLNTVIYKALNYSAPAAVLKAMLCGKE